MSNWRTEEETKSHQIQLMGPDLGPVFHELYFEIVWLSFKVNQFETLFGEQKSVDLLNRASPNFASLVQRVLSDDILLHLARLTDPRVKGNLTIQSLEIMVKCDIRKTVRAKIGLARTKAAFVQPRRNKRIAHHDFDFAMGRNAKPLPGGTLREIKEAIEAITRLMNYIAHEYIGTEYAFDPVSPAPMDLLRVLEEGLRNEE